MEPGVLPGRCRTSGWVYHTASAAGFLHSFEMSSAPAGKQAGKQEGKQTVENACCIHAHQVNVIAVILDVAPLANGFRDDLPVL